MNNDLKTRIKDIKAVLFDMDGTMFDTEALHMAIFGMILKEWGIEHTKERYINFIGRNRRDCKKLLLSVYGLESPEKADEFYSKFEVYATDIVSEKTIKPKPGAFELLETLKEAGIRWAVVTSSSQSIAEMYMRVPGRPTDPDVIITGDMVSRGKPEPEPYLTAAEKLGLSPDECLVLEDAPSGIESATRAGMPVIMIPDMLEPTEAEYKKAAAILPSLNEVISLFQSREEA